MGFMDKVKGIDKAGDVVDDKTGGKYAQHVDKGQDAVKDALGQQDGTDKGKGIS